MYWDAVEYLTKRINYLSIGCQINKLLYNTINTRCLGSHGHNHNRHQFNGPKQEISLHKGRLKSKKTPTVGLDFKVAMRVVATRSLLM